MTAADPLHEERVVPLLRGRFGRPWLWRASCPSTQDLLRGSDLPEGAVAVTEHQSAGRGRLGRSWESPSGTSVMFSLLLRPPQTSIVPQLSLVLGLALAETIEAIASHPAMVKWPNDVLLDGRKTAGILIENDGDAVVCGIGVNVAQAEDELPTNTRVPPTSIRVTTGKAVDRAALLATLLDRLEQRYDLWRAEGLAPLLPALEPRNALAGTHARAGELVGLVGPIAPDGRLILTDGAGRTHRVVSGELELI